MCQRKIAYWVIPPEADAEFAAHMEEVLETYARPFDWGLYRRVPKPALAGCGKPLSEVRIQ